MSHREEELRRVLRDRAIDLTMLLRESPRLEIHQLRRFVESSGLDVETAILADFHPEDVRDLYGVLVTSDRRVFQFDVIYEVDPGPGPQEDRINEAWVEGWHEVSTDEERDENRYTIEAALALLDEGADQPRWWDAFRR